MDTTRLSHLYDDPGPFATVMIDVSQDSENGRHEHDLRVRAAADALTEQGAPASVVEQVTARLDEQIDEPSPVARTVVVSPSGVLLDQVGHHRVDQPHVRWAVLPDLGPWIDHQDAVTTFVLAVVDHEGGDVAVYDSDVPEPQEQTTAGGETYRVHKVPVGGWSALRYQHVTENVWARNAEAVADEVEHNVRAGHRLVLLAGDPQSLPVVRERLAETPATVVQLESGSRSADGGEEALQQAIREALMAHVVERRLDDLHELRDRMGAGTSVATGVDEVADAFVRGQVDTLLIDPQGTEELTFEPERHPGLTFGAVTPGSSVPAGQALVAAAVTTAARVRVAPGPALGTPVAALLRWDQQAVGSEAG